MKTHEVKRSVAQSVTQHTILAAFATVDSYGVPSGVTRDLRADMHELAQLEGCPLVDAAKSLVKIAIEHSISPSETTHTLSRIARDVLGDLLINTKEIKG